MAGALVASSCGRSAAPQHQQASAGTDRPAVEVTILYGSEKKTWLDEQIAAFDARTYLTKDGRRIHVTGTPTGSGEGMAAILDGSAHPTVFSPASSAYLTLLDDAWQRSHPRPIAPAGPPLVLSPVVIAMWKPTAQSLGWPDRRLGWRDILTARDGFQLGHTNPEHSSSGLLATLAIAYAATGKTRGLAAADMEQVAPFMQRVEASIVHYGPSTGQFADRMMQGPSYLSAAVLYENLVVELNQRGPVEPIVSIYPVEGTFWADHPYSVLDGEWNGAAEREAAQVFLEFLEEPAQQARALALGFRPANPQVAVGPPIDAEHGADARQPQTLLEVPDAPALTALLATWRRAKKPADIVFVFDKSGSMLGRPLDEAKAGAKAFLDTLDPRDRVTLLYFDREIYEPIGPFEVGRGRASLDASLDGISAGGDTSLYDVTHEALALVAARPDRTRIHAVVVMTDGVDNGSQRGVDELAGDFARHPTPTFTIGYGDQANAEILGRIARYGGGTYARGDVSTIANVYREVATCF